MLLGAREEVGIGGEIGAPAAARTAGRPVVISSAWYLVYLPIGHVGEQG